MSNLIPSGVGPSGLPIKLERQVSREVARIKAGAVVKAAEQTAKAAVLEEVVEATMLATARMSQLEELLATQTPSAAARLRFIADTGAMGMAAVVQQTARKVM